MGRIRKVTLGVLFLVPLLTFGAINAAASNGPHEDKGKPAEAANPSHPDKPGQAKKAESGSSSSQAVAAQTGGSAAIRSSTSSDQSAEGSGEAAAQTSASGDQKTHPPGNDGTVKIDGMPWDSAPNNEPHVGCIMQIDFYGYEQGPWDAYFELELHAPTGSGYLGSGWEYVGEDANGGGQDLDGSVTYDLRPALAASGVQPHPKQRYHVRLTVVADGYSIGGDEKHKMFWVNCASTTQGGNEVTPTPTPTTSPGGNNSAPSPTSSGTVLGATATPGSSGTVLGATITPGSGGLAFTGSDIVVPLIAMLALLLAAAAGLHLARRLDRTG